MGIQAIINLMVARREQQGRVQIGALGVGLDLSGFYSRTQAADLGAMRVPQLHRELLALLGRGGRR